MLKLIIAATLLAATMASTKAALGNSDLPPPHLDKPYHGVIEWRPVPLHRVAKVCEEQDRRHGLGTFSAPSRDILLGCATVDAGTCYIVTMDKDYYSRKKGWLSVARIFRHERGHCNDLYGEWIFHGE